MVTTTVQAVAPYGRGRKRTPGALSGVPMNSTPAASSVLCKAPSVRAWAGAARLLTPAI